MQRNKGTWLKWALISCGIVLGIAAAVILAIPAFISGNFVQQKVTRLLDERLDLECQIGTLSFDWPNQISISHIAMQKRGDAGEEPIKIEHIQGNVKLLPLLFEKIIVKNISIREINYGNRLLIKDLFTNKFSWKDGVISTRLRLTVNEGATIIKGMIDLREKTPAFDLSVEAHDVHITQDVPSISILPIFATKNGEVGGLLSIAGFMRGKGFGKEILNKHLIADVKLEVRNGYIKGNKLLSSILNIAGIKDVYSFDLIEAAIQIKDGKISTPKMDIHSSILGLSASGVTGFDGSIAYDATVRLSKERMGKDVEKIAGLLLQDNALPIEIRGTTKDPKVSVKLPKENLENLVKGLVDDFLSKPKKKKEKKSN